MLIVAGLVAIICILACGIMLAEKVNGAPIPTGALVILTASVLLAQLAVRLIYTG